MKKVIILTVILYSISCTEPPLGLDELVDNCNNQIPQVENFDSQYDEYLYYKSKWDCLDIQSYSFENTSRLMACYGVTHLVAVNNDEIESFDIIEDPIGLAQVFKCNLFHIEELFSRIDNALNPESELYYEFYTEEPKYTADLVRINYDQGTGIPLEGVIDYVYGVADDEFEFELSSLKMIN